jgi:hypothetical protein
MLIASTMNGASVDLGVYGNEITVRPDQLVLIVLAPILGLGYVAGAFRLHLLLFDWLVLGFVVSNLAASLLWSSSVNVSLKGSLLLAGYAAMYLLVKETVANRAQWVPRASNWVFGLGVAQAAYSLIAVALYAFGYPIGGLQIGHLRESSVAIKGTFWEPNLLGAYLGVITLCLMVRYLMSSDRQSGARYLAGMFVTSLALPLTVTRAAGAAFGVGLLAVALIVLVYRGEIHRWRMRTARIAITLCCVVLLTGTAMNSLVSALSGYPNLLLERWAPISFVPPSGEVFALPEGTSARPGKALATGEVLRASRSSVHGRMDAWARAVQEWRHLPVLGHGTLAGVEVIEDGWWYSSLVQALYDTGLVGFVVLLGIYVAAIVYPVRTWLRARAGPSSANLLAFGVGNTVLFVTSQFSNFLFVGFPWVFLGVTMGAVEASRSRQR